MNITKETIIKTRQWFIDNTQGCIDEAVSGQVRVNDLENYVESMLKRMDDIGAGEWSILLHSSNVLSTSKLANATHCFLKDKRS